MHITTLTTCKTLLQGQIFFLGGGVQGVCKFINGVHTVRYDYHKFHLKKMCEIAKFKK